jgi:hypothetical protein
VSPRDRNAILARRARFVAAALAGAGLGACGSAQPRSEPSQEIIVPSPDAAPPEEPTDAALPPRAGPSAGPEVESPPDIGPRICLSEL